MCFREKASVIVFLLPKYPWKRRFGEVDDSLKTKTCLTLCCLAARSTKQPWLSYLLCLLCAMVVLQCSKLRSRSYNSRKVYNYRRRTCAEICLALHKKTRKLNFGAFSKKSQKLCPPKLPVIRYLSIAGSCQKLFTVFATPTQRERTIVCFQ